MVGNYLFIPNIELTEVNIAFKTPGRLVERTVDEGDTVKKGQVIARLDRDQLLAQRDRETAGLNSAISQLATIRIKVGAGNSSPMAVTRFKAHLQMNRERSL